MRSFYLKDGQKLTSSLLQISYMKSKLKFFLFHKKYPKKMRLIRASERPFFKILMGQRHFAMWYEGGVTERIGRRIIINTSSNRKNYIKRININVVQCLCLFSVTSELCFTRHPSETSSTKPSHWCYMNELHVFA